MPRELPSLLDTADWGDGWDTSTEPLMQISADSMAWEDADGRDTWPEGEALSLAADLIRKGYRVTLHEV